MKDKPTGIELKFFELCSMVAKQQGLELYDLDYQPGRGHLTVFIFDPSSDTAVLDDCVKMDRALTPYIDEESWMPEKLTLEVSSPGIFRKLTSDWHFKNAIGKMVMLQLGQKFEMAELPKKFQGAKKLRGLLVEKTDSSVSLDVEGVKVNLPIESIKKANLDPNIWSE